MCIRDSNYAEEMKVSPAFYHTVYDALMKACFMEIAKLYDLSLIHIFMQEAGYEIKTGKYISFRAEGQERFTRSKTIGENYTEERIKERIAGRTPRRNRRQTCLLYTSGKRPCRNGNPVE